MLHALALLTTGVCAFDCDGDGNSDSVGVGLPGKDCDGNGWADACDLARRFVMKGTVFEESRVNRLLTGDLDSDGDVDVVASAENETYLLLNGGTGVFTSMLGFSHRFGTPAGVADLENDGDLDLFIYSFDGLLTYVNQGQGVFIEGKSIRPLEGGPLDLGDLDADGDLDVAAQHASPPVHDIVALIQEDIGVFRGPVTLGPNLQARSGCIEDLNGDGVNDLAVMTDSNVIVLHNQGTLPFEKSGEYILGTNPIAILAGDVDVDGDKDLVTANAASELRFQNISVLANAGDGTFALPRNYAASLSSMAVQLEDLDGDLDLDILGIGPEFQGIRVVWNDGAQGFRLEEVWDTPLPVRIVTPIDLDADGDRDLALILRTKRHSSIVALVNDGKGKFRLPPFESGDGGILALAAGDFDGDGDSDLASAGFSPPELATFVNEGSLAVERVHGFSENPGDLNAADLDADGDLDLAVTVSGLSLFSNLGGRDFEPLPPIEDMRGSSRLVAADLDADGLVDIAAIREKSVHLLFNLGGWGFGRPEAFQLDGFALSILKADLDQDSRMDLVIAARDVEGFLSFLRNRGNGAFTISHSRIGISTFHMDAADLDGDGDTDLVLGDSALAILEGLGDATFAAPRMHSSGHVGVVALHDLDTDGDVDVAASREDEQLVLHFNTGAGSFTGGTNRQAGDVLDMVAVDFDGDGDSDLALGREERGLLVLDNSMDPLHRDCNGNSIPDSCDLAAGVLVDANGDGLADDCGSIPFTRGDVDMSVEVNITDAIRTLNWLFIGGEPLPCHSSADADDNSAIDLTDPIYLLRFLFLSGDAPSAPFPGCGKDATIDDLGCRSAKTCPR